MTFVVREMPLLTKVEFRGLKAIPLKEIEDTTDLKAGNRADPTRTRLAVSQIQRFYAAKGYDLASVTLIEGGNPADTQIVIEILEGPKVKVKNISFVGNQFAAGAQLRVKIATRKPIPELSGRYHSDMLDDGRQKLIEYYQSQGFFEVKVTPVTRPGARPGRNRPDLRDCRRNPVQGPQRDHRGQYQDQNRKAPGRIWSFCSGKPFVKSLNEADKNRMLIKYGELGYIDAQIACEPRFTDQLGVVDLVYKIEENGPFFVSEATVRRYKSSKKSNDPTQR